MFPHYTYLATTTLEGRLVHQSVGKAMIDSSKLDHHASLRLSEGFVHHKTVRMLVTRSGSNLHRIGIAYLRTAERVHISIDGSSGQNDYCHRSSP